MDIKILSSLDSVNVTQPTVTIGTHNGIFHSDEVVACSILAYIFSDFQNVVIVRTRDPKVLEKCDILVDIGGGDFDHHIKGFNIMRENGKKYASAGLIWRFYGDQFLRKVYQKYFENIPFFPNLILNTFDTDIISPVDDEDNGVIAPGNKFTYISSFLPPWFDTTASILNKQFESVINITIPILEQEAKRLFSKAIITNMLITNWSTNNGFKNGILEVPSQTNDCLEAACVINSDYADDGGSVNFVIFPYPAGGWAAQCVPKSVEDKFSQRIPFPAEWAGLTDTLAEVSGIGSATFCHNGCFFARAKEKSDIIKMCMIASKA